jgi:hypothetical protein
MDEDKRVVRVPRPMSGNLVFSQDYLLSSRGSPFHLNNHFFRSFPAFKIVGSHATHVPNAPLKAFEVCLCALHRVHLDYATLGSGQTKTLTGTSPLRLTRRYDFDLQHLGWWCRRSQSERLSIVNVLQITGELYSIVIEDFVRWKAIDWIPFYENSASLVGITEVSPSMKFVEPCPSSRYTPVPGASNR